MRAPLVPDLFYINVRLQASQILEQTAERLEHPAIGLPRAARRPSRKANATVLGRVKRWVPAMLACEDQAARGCAPALSRRF
jgi:hypothetical protein